MTATRKSAGGELLVLVSNWEQRTPTAPNRPRRLRKPRESRRAKRERIAALDNAPVPQLFQSISPIRTPSLYRPKGYTGCLEGFFRSARQRLKTVLRNNRMLGRRFTHFVNINLYSPRHPELINRDFRELVKRLEAAGLIGHWTIEVDRKNIVHWHLLFVNFHGSDKTLKKMVSGCLGEVNTFPRRRVHAQPIWNQRQKVEYCLKVKKAGHGEAFDPLDRGKRQRRSSDRSDIYARNRILFRPNTGLDKHGTFGKFWAEGMNEKKLWEVICEETRTVARNYENPRIRRLVDDIHSRLGIPLARVKWAYCLNPPCHLLSGQPLVAQAHTGGTSPCSSGLVRSLFGPRHPPGASIAACPSLDSFLVGQPRQAFLGSPGSSPEAPAGVLADSWVDGLSCVVSHWLRLARRTWRRLERERPYRGHDP